MNKHVFAIGILAMAVCVLEYECCRLRAKLAEKELECELHKFCSKSYEFCANGYKRLYEAQKAETKEA